MRAFVEARAAATFPDPGEASRRYLAALSADPANQILASNALNHALAAGDRTLAVRAATTLAAGETVSPEVRLTLLTEAVRTRNWRVAGAQIDRIADDNLFGFMAPILRAWVAVGSGRGDPAAILDAATGNVVQNYLPESRALIQLARRPAATAEAYAGFADQSGTRSQRLRIAGAALLARRGARREALALLAGPGDALARARAAIGARRALPGEIATANQGIAEFLVRLALDLNAQEVRPLAVRFARLATFLAPENSEAWLITAELLAAQDRNEPALAALANVRADDPFAGAAREVRTRLLVETARPDAAIAEALAATGTPGAQAVDWSRLGDLYTEVHRYREAAEAYERAIALAGEGSADNPLWALWLIRGSALEKGGDWAAGRAALERAYQLAPDQPIVLNYLGYAQLERRENIVEATRLVAEAHRLAPDDASITDSLGWAHFLNGDLAQAIQLLEEAARGQPADVTINEHLGDAYYRAGRRLDARYAWRAALVHAEGADAERLRAKIDTGLTPRLAAR